MTREEQIKQAEVKYSDDTLFDGCDYIGQVAKQEAFIAGAKWADKTMIDNACKWIEDNIFDFPWYDSEVEFSSKDVADAFRKAMEE